MTVLGMEPRGHSILFPAWWCGLLAELSRIFVFSSSWRLSVAVSEVRAGRPGVLISGGGWRSAGVTLLLLFHNCFLPRPATVATAGPLPELWREVWREVWGADMKLAIVTADLRENKR